LIVRDLSTPFYAELTAGLTEALEAGAHGLFITWRQRWRTAGAFRYVA
jgi:hypothetical protein